MATPTAQGTSIYSDRNYPAQAVVVVEPRPRLASTLVGVGAVFVLIEAFVFLIAGVFLSSSQFAGIAGALITGGIGDAIVGVLLFGVSLLINAEPHHHVANGLLALVLAVLSLFVGFGGFFIGFLLATIGAFAAIFWTAPAPTIVTVTRRPPGQ